MSCARMSRSWSGCIRADPAGLTLHCIPRQDFGARVIPEASAPVIDPRTKPASLPERRNEFDVRHFGPRSRTNPIGRSLAALVQQWAVALSALDLRRLGITPGPLRFGFGKTLFLQRLVRATSLAEHVSLRTSGAHEPQVAADDDDCQAVESASSRKTLEVARSSAAAR